MSRIGIEPCCTPSSAADHYGVDGGRRWSAHLQLTRINTKLTIPKNQIEECRIFRAFWVNVARDRSQTVSRRRRQSQRIFRRLSSEYAARFVHAVRVTRLRTVRRLVPHVYAGIEDQRRSARPRAQSSCALVDRMIVAVDKGYWSADPQTMAHLREVNRAVIPEAGVGSDPDSWSSEEVIAMGANARTATPLDEAEARRTLGPEPSPFPSDTSSPYGFGGSAISEWRKCVLRQIGLTHVTQPFVAPCSELGRHRPRTVAPTAGGVARADVGERLAVYPRR